MELEIGAENSKAGTMQYLSGLTEMNGFGCSGMLKVVIWISNRVD